MEGKDVFFPTHQKFFLLSKKIFFYGCDMSRLDYGFISLSFNGGLLRNCLVALRKLTLYAIPPRCTREHFVNTDTGNGWRINV